ncbi:MMPL family transporter, partial [Burkholderia ambifaria]|uniref:MMPL family transporter n=1 Tax=Burkholderia ambifaria TaxID=152480 RepID=UPI001B9350EB
MDERTRPPTPVTRRLPAWRQRAVLVWLLALVACGIAIARVNFTADLSAFLPRAPNAGQRVLVEQLRDGIVSRLILVAIDGGDAATRAALSRRVAGTLRADRQFSAINNGEAVNDARDQQFVFDHRYLLSPAVTPQRFSADGLHQALGDSLDLLGSSAGLVAKAMLPRDPTGEVTALVDQLDSGAQPAVRDGVWASRDGTRAVLVVQTAAAGSDTDAQARAIDAVRRAFSAATQALPSPAAYTLAMTGPGVFSVDTRDTIRHDVERLSIASLVLIVALLLTLYRSPRTLALGLLPVLTGIAAGIAAVSVAFGTVHGLTLGFGTTLIGEAVDYSIYLFVQSAQTGSRGAARPADAMRAWLAAYWPTIRLGVLTSVCGFASMLFSGFPGLVQLGLYSIVGLTAAALVTRYVLPHLRGEHVAIRDVSRIGAVLARAAAAAPRLRWPLAVLVLGACATLVLHRESLWSRELAALSPVPARAQALDARLRADVGAPDVRYLVVISAPTEQAALERAEQVAAQLQPLVERGALAGFESPARYLPSDAAQRARQASLPDANALAARMRAAVANQPISVKSELFAPFVADVEAARHAPLLTRADLRGTSMALAVDALLNERAGRWSAMLPLRAPDAART